MRSIDHPKSRRNKKALARLASGALAATLLWTCAVPFASASEPAATVAPSSAATAFAGVTLNTTTPAMYGKLEMTFDLSTSYANPFDPEEVDAIAEIRTPSGEVERVPAFYRSDASPQWAVRYSPRQQGRHVATLRVADKNGVSSSEAYDFTAGTPEEGRGFMGVSGDRFVDSFGRQLTLLGTNYAWSSPADITAAMPEYKDANMNLMRFWLTCWWANYSPEYGPVTTTQNGITMSYNGIGDYNLDNLERMDTVMEAAEANGIYLMLTLNSFGDFYYDWAYHAYNRANGGPSDWKENDTDFWYNPEALRYQERLLRYVFARWGYSTSLGMLEYWNESDNRVDTETWIRDSWHRSMDTYWKSLDFYNHPTTTSFAWKDHVEQHATQDSWDNLDTLDVVNMHLYEDRSDIVDVWEASLDALRQFGDRPIFMGEVGKTHNDASTDEELLNYLHDGLWSPIFRAGAAGGNLWWIFENGFNPPAQYKAQYKVLADFVQPEEGRILYMPVQDVAASGEGVQASGYVSGDRALLWANDRLSPYDAAEPRAVTGAELTLEGMQHGPYQVTYYNTYTGETVGEARVTANADGLKLKLPAFVRDVAVKAVHHQADEEKKDKKAPTAPGNVTVATASEDAIQLQWTASEDNVGVAGYDIYRGALLVGQTHGPATTFKDTILTSGTTYAYTVKARDLAGNRSAASASVQATTLAADVAAPTAPSNLAVTDVAEGTVDLAWDASAEDRALDGYLVYRDGVLVGITRSTTYRDTELRPGRSYVYTVKAKDTSVNVSAASNAVEATTEAPPMTPNLLANPGFETVVDGKPANWACEQAWYCVADSAEKRSGETSLGIDDTTGAWFGIASDAAPAIAGNTYVLEGFVNIAENFGTFLKVRLQFLNGVGSILDDKTVHVYSGTTNGYDNVYGAFVAPEHTRQVRVYAYIEGLNAKINLDDFSIKGYGPHTQPEEPEEPSGNLLLNGNFDARNDAWKTAIWTCEKDWLCQWTDLVKRTTGEGTASMRILTYGADWFGVYQDAVAAAGATYTFDGYAKIAAKSAGMLQVKLAFYDASGGLLAEEWLADLDAVSEDWVRVQGAKTAPAGTAKVRVLVYANGFHGDANLDDFSLVKQ